MSSTKTTRRLLDTLGHSSRLDIAQRSPEPDAASFFVPLSFAKDGATLSHFWLITTVGTSQAVWAEELRLEYMIPADDEIQHRHGDLISRRGVARRSNVRLSRFAELGSAITDLFELAGAANVKSPLLRQRTKGK